MIGYVEANVTKIANRIFSKLVDLLGKCSIVILLNLTLPLCIYELTSWFLIGGVFIGVHRLEKVEGDRIGKAILLIDCWSWDYVERWSTRDGERWRDEEEDWEKQNHSKCASSWRHTFIKIIRFELRSTILIKIQENAFSLQTNATWTYPYLELKW